jgi:hypothetical protein
LGSLVIRGLCALYSSAFSAEFICTVWSFITLKAYEVKDLSVWLATAFLFERDDAGIEIIWPVRDDVSVNWPQRAALHTGMLWVTSN